MNDGPQAPPQDLEAEQCVLGAVLLSDTALPAIEEEGLAPEDFYRPAHRLVLEAMQALAGKGEGVDALTISAWLKHRGRLEAAGGQATIDLLASSVPAVGHLRSYCRIVKSKARWRARLRAALEQQAACNAENAEAHARAVAMIDGLERDQEGRFDTSDDFLRWAERKVPLGFPTPFEQLTDALGGALIPGDVTVMGGWPGHGKTVLADQFVLHAHGHGARSHIYMNEMLPALRTARMVAGLSGVAWPRIRAQANGKGDLTSDEWARVFEALGKLPAEYTPIAGRPVEFVTRDLLRHRWDVAVVDTATRIPARDASEAAHNSGALANAAREAGTHLILVLQLNLERCKTLKRPAPTGRDLLGTGAWYQDARNVIFAHRKQEEIGSGKDKDAVRVLLEGNILCDKATHGEPEHGFMAVTLNPNMMRFTLPAHGDEPGSDTTYEDDKLPPSTFEAGF